MTSKQLERKVNQLYSRKKLVETVDDLEEVIKAFMLLEGKSEIYTEKFIISLVNEKLDISARTSVDQNQLILNFTNPKEKEERINESIDPQKTITGSTRFGERRRVKAYRFTNPEGCQDHR